MTTKPTPTPMKFNKYSLLDALICAVGFLLAAVSAYLLFMLTFPDDFL